MLTLHGKGVFGGVAIGKISFYKHERRQVRRDRVEDAAAEVLRFEASRDTAVAQLGALYDKALPEVGEANAQIFQIHQMMLEDLDYYDSIVNIITTQQVNAEYAVATTGDNFAQMFAAMDDAYMQARSADVKDISERVVRVLSGVAEDGVKGDEPVIVAADDLAPSETVQLDKSRILAFVTQAGSANSHTAILARTMNIPAVIGAGDTLDESVDGRLAIVDGFTGDIFIEPDAETVARLTKKKEQALERAMLLQELRGKESVTRGGKRVELCANIGSPSDVGAALQNDAEGVGLYRSEFLYLESHDYPTEEAQFVAYKTVAENMAGKRVIVRTLDIGADKQVDYFKLPHEENPALGYRAIRICLTQQDIFRTQLRALLRASAFGRIAIMFPMITAACEVREILEIVASVKEELRAQQIAFSPNVELGIMIETPAAALVSDELAKLVDFFSVGTNDLTQYTLAIDRQNQSLERFFDPHHPAVLKLIEIAAKNAHNNGIWIGICGELGADPALTADFLRMDIDELSVSPACILGLRKQIREME